MKPARFLMFVYLPMLLIVGMFVVEALFWSGWTETIKHAIVVVVIYAYGPIALAQLASMRERMQKLAEKEGL